MFEGILKKVRPLSMVPDSGIMFTMKEALSIIEKGVPGDFVECGTWKGGCSIAMLMAQREVYGRIIKPVHFFDSFEGLPLAQKIDGKKALDWQADTKGKAYYDNCRASYDELEETLTKFEFNDDEAIVWPGWFENTLPKFGLEPIAMLRLDCDWYHSIKSCLNHLMWNCSPGSTVIIDDYHAWEGCTRAIHEWLYDNNLSYRIESLPDRSSAFFRIP